MMRVVRVIVCDSCEAEFHFKHDMDTTVYRLEFCPFCGKELNQDLIDELEDDDDYIW